MISNEGLLRNVIDSIAGEISMGRMKTLTLLAVAALLSASSSAPECSAFSFEGEAYVCHDQSASAQADEDACVAHVSRAMGDHSADTTDEGQAFWGAVGDCLSK